MTMIQTEEMRLRAETRTKPTYELRDMVKASETPEQTRKIVEEILWERGKSKHALPFR